MKKFTALSVSFTILSLTSFTVLAVEPTYKPTPSAVEYIKTRLSEFDRTLYVYKDASDGNNHFTQKAWYGSNYSNIPVMIEDDSGLNGSTGVKCEIDFKKHTWGGYMFVTGALNSGSTIPIIDFGKTNTGLNLTGAKKLIFYAKGEKGGEQVEFFMGGYGHNETITAKFADSTQKISIGYKTLKSNWTRYEIPLNNIALDRISCGFGWVTNNLNNLHTKNIRFYVDDIHFEFSNDKLKPLFLTSYAPGNPETDDAVINNFAYLYDNCAAALALSYANEHERARQIADAIVFAANNDRYFTDGRVRNAYMAGEPQSDPGWNSQLGKKFARMPGFWSAKDKRYYEDFYSVSTSTGNAAWAILALCEVYSNAPERNDYLETAKKIADFVLTLKGINGFTGGYEGWEGNQIKVSYSSTEHNIDLISAFGRLFKLTGETKYTVASSHAKAFVLSMYDAKLGCFYTGTENDKATINKTVMPLDCQTWAISAMPNFKDNNKILEYVQQNFAINGGYSFSAEYKNSGVWFEGTAQTALAYKLMGYDKKANDILSYLNINRLSDGAITAADRNGLNTGFMVSGTDIPWNYNKRQHLGATAWLAFTQMWRNPFAY